ncbi:MAG: hypothetical protein ACXWJW_07110 [Xanthobacteraceae bacterium]
MDLENLRLHNETFSPETLALLSSAFERAWDTVVKSGAMLADREKEIVRDRLAKRILEMARRGERDVAKLVNDALEHVTRPMSDPETLLPK